MKLEELNPFIRYGGCHKYYNNSSENSICYDCRLFFISSGEGKLFVEDEELQITNNTVIFFPPHSKYRFKFRDNYAVSIYVLNFDLTNEFFTYSRSFGTATEGSFDENKLLKFPSCKEFGKPIIGYNAFDLYKRMSKCIEVFQNKDEFYKQKASALLKLLLIDVLNISKNKNGEYEIARHIIEYIREHYDEVDLTNSVIAEKFNYHSYHLNRIFKTYTSKPIHSYLLEYRLQKAKDLLNTTILSVTEIAEKVGFSSYTYFIKLFRERVGMSPLKYRKMHVLTRL